MSGSGAKLSATRAYKTRYAKGAEAREHALASPAHIRKEVGACLDHGDEHSQPDR